MNIKDYIESGIVATYVLGLATEDEQREFEHLCTKYPELYESKITFEQALEDQLMKEAVPLPEGLKEQVLAPLRSFSADTIPVPKKLNKQPAARTTLWKILAAASIILMFAGSFYFAYYFNKKYQKVLQENAFLKNELEKTSYTNPIVTIDPIVQNPAVKWSAMMASKNASHCVGHVYWDSVSAKTYLLVGNIPRPIANKHFQLWAVYNNKAINLGMFDSKSQGKVMQMKNVAKAKTFVITIEQQGPTSTPLKEATYALGKL